MAEPFLHIIRRMTLRQPGYVQAELLENFAAHNEVAYKGGFVMGGGAVLDGKPLKNVIGAKRMVHTYDCLSILENPWITEYNCVIRYDQEVSHTDE